MSDRSQYDAWVGEELKRHPGHAPTSWAAWQAAVLQERLANEGGAMNDILNGRKAAKQDQPDVLAVLRTLFGGDVLMNNTSGRYLSDHIEELIEARVQEAARQERAACAKLVEDYYTHGDHTQGWQDIFAERIRARSSATGEKG